MVFGLGADGRISHQEMFGETDFPGALARLEALGAASPVDRRHPRAENTATRTRSTALELFNEGRFAEAAVFTDLRPQYLDLGKRRSGS